jgi:diphthamide biosynthesis methyltransferase
MELVDITPEDSVVPVYLEVLTDEEQAERDAEMAAMLAEQEEREAEAVAKEELKQAALARLGLSEEEIKAIFN